MVASLLNSVLPTSDGWLASWQLFIAATALFNSVQNFMTLKLTKRVYARTPHVVSPLQARTFGIWTLTSAVVRGYAAYHINEKPVYDICLITYLIAFCHFTSELLIFKTAKLTFPFASTLFVSIGSMVWMLSQYDFYLTT